MGRRNSITEQWAARPVEMLESPAYRVLSLSAHRVLSRIEIEFAHHGGKDNGKLPVTFDDFARYGVRRHSIGPALLELEALGFIVITEHGAMAKAAEYRRSNKFLLASRPKQKGVEVAGRWRQFKTVKEAEAAVEAARRNPPFRAAQRKSRQCRNGTVTSAETALRTENRQCRNGTTVHGRNGTTIYISGRGPFSAGWGERAEEPAPPSQMPAVVVEPIARSATPTQPSNPRAAQGILAGPVTRRPAMQTLAGRAFSMIDGCYRISGRAELVVLLVARRDMLPLATRMNDGSAFATAAE